MTSDGVRSETTVLESSTKRRATELGGLPSESLGSGTRSYTQLPVTRLSQASYTAKWPHLVSKSFSHFPKAHYRGIGSLSSLYKATCHRGHVDVYPFKTSATISAFSTSLPKQSTS